MKTGDVEESCDFGANLAQTVSKVVFHEEGCHLPSVSFRLVIN